MVVLIVILFAILLALSSFVSAIFLELVVRGGLLLCSRTILLLPLLVTGVSLLGNGEVHINILAFFKVDTLIVIHCF
jgi:hypothetical protein